MQHSHVLVAIADGSEEMEAVITIDLLRRAKLHVTVASVESSLTVTASRGVKITADTAINTCTDTAWTMIVLPGGMPGAKTLGDNAALMNLVKAQAAAGRWVAAICAAPAVALAANGLLTHKTATCYPAFRNQLREHGATVSEDAVVIDPPFITSQGPGTAGEFALAIIEQLAGHAQRTEVANAALLRSL